jgi:uncharacterized protein (TIGR02757 family)
MLAPHHDHPLPDDGIKAFLDEKVWQYNTPAFIESDPIGIPHRYDRKEDIEVSGFFAASLAWGGRAQIVRAAARAMELMGHSPFDFVMEADEAQIARFDGFVYRTFRGEDMQGFVRGLRHIYGVHGGMEAVFARYAAPDSVQGAIHHFRRHFFEPEHPLRTEKHLSDPLKGSAAKRINMLLRWLVRNDRRGVDFGLWQSIRPAQLSCPLDVHSGNVARQLGLLRRTQNDARAVAELDAALRAMDPEDPVKYDFALFGLGVFEGW